MVKIFKITNRSDLTKAQNGSKPKQVSYPPPVNYQKIDEFVSRSAQLTQENIKWLKKEGVTDVVNFETVYSKPMQFSEQKALERLDMTYHGIPTIGNDPKEIRINNFFKLIEQIRESNGQKKLHIHCTNGGNKTGFYSLLYKTKYKIGTWENNVKEMIKMGHDVEAYPNLIKFAKNYIDKLK